MSKKSSDAAPLADVDDRLPSIEDVMGMASWDDRIAQARIRREKILEQRDGTGGSSPVKAAANKPDTPPQKKPVASVDANAEPTVNDNTPSIEDILTTTNLNDRLELAKIRREQVLAQRGQGAVKLAQPLPGGKPGTLKDTVRVAVSGFESLKQDVEVAEKTQSASDPRAVTPLVEPTATGKSRALYGYAAAGLAAALVIGFFVPNPLRDNLLGAPDAPVQVANTPQNNAAPPDNESAVQSTQQAVTAETAITEAVTAETVSVAAGIPNLPEPVVLEIVDTLLANSAGLSFAPAPIVPATENFTPVLTTSAGTLARPGIEVTPTLATETFVALTPLDSIGAQTVEQSETIVAAPLATAPAFTETVAGLAPVTDTVSGDPLFVRLPAISTISDTGRPVGVASSIPTGLTLDIALAVQPTQIGRVTSSPTATVSSFEPTILNAALTAAPTVFPALEGNIFAPAGSDLTNAGDAWFRPTEITFLSGPSGFDLPVNVPALFSGLPIEAMSTQLAIPAEPPGAFQPDASIPGVLVPATRLASIGFIASAPVQNDPAIVPDLLEPFDDMVARSVNSLSVSISIPGQNGSVLDAAGYSIQVHAPSNLPDDKLNAFTTALRETGFSVKDPKRVGFSISKNNIRYFHAGDAEAAQILAEAVDGTARDFTSFSPSPPVGTIEVWLAGKKTSGKKTKRTSNRSSTSSGSGSGDPAMSAIRSRIINSMRRGDHL